MVEIQDQIYKSIDFIEKVQSKYSLACSLLELSRNWDLFIQNWFDNSNFSFLFGFVWENNLSENLKIEEVD